MGKYNVEGDWGVLYGGNLVWEVVMMLCKRE